MQIGTGFLAAPCWWCRNTFRYEILTSGPSAMTHLCGTAGAGSHLRSSGRRTQERFFQEGGHRPLIPTFYPFPDERPQPISSLLQTRTSPSSRLCRRNPLFSPNYLSAPLLSYHHHHLSEMKVLLQDARMEASESSCAATRRFMVVGGGFIFEGLFQTDIQMICSSSPRCSHVLSDSANNPTRRLTDV